MNFLNLIVIFVLIVILFFLLRFSIFSKNERAFKKKANITFDKRNLNKWMNLTKKERYNFSRKEAVSNLNKRKVLLEEIRKEYKRISKS